MSGNNSQRGEIHNYRNDYKFNYEIKQKANGEEQQDRHDSDSRDLSPSYDALQRHFEVLHDMPSSRY